MLAEYGYNTKSLSSGEKFFGVIQEFNPDLVLMDLMLANIDGRAICRNIKEKPEMAKLPVILVSGTHDLARTLYELSAPNDCVPKPFDIDFLLAKIKRRRIDLKSPLILKLLNDHGMEILIRLFRYPQIISFYYMLV